MSLFAAAGVAWAEIPADTVLWKKSTIPSEVTVGDRFELELALGEDGGPAAASSDAFQKAFLKLPEEQEKTALQDGFFLEALPTPRIGVAVTVTRAGSISVPPLPLFDVGGNTGDSGLKTESLDLSVRSAISAKDEKPSEPEPLLPPMRLALSWFWRITLSLGILLLFGASGYFFWRHRRAENTLPQMPGLVRTHLSADVWATRELEKIAQEESWSTGNFKRHYFAVSEVLKNYIALRFEIDAVESLNNEILRDLEAQSLPGAWLDQLESQLSCLDRVKFTDFKPDWNEPPRVVEDALRWVQLTRKVEPKTP